MTAPFILGTVQLGLDYGIANKGGMPSEEAAFAVLDAAMAAGVETLDTARAYGRSEEVIGRWLEASDAAPAIVTKTPRLGDGDWQAAEAAFEESLARLGADSVAGLLLHDVADLARPGLRDWAEGLLGEGRIGAFGVSLYEAAAIPADPLVSLVQLPLNVFVQGAAHEPATARFLARGGRVHARSVLVQGLVMLDGDLPPGLEACRPFVEGFAGIAREAGVSCAALAIAAARSLLPEAEAVLGAETAEQVAELAAFWATAVDPAVVDAAIALGRTAPAALFDPRTWPAR